jgi:hypothetical protein
VAPKIMLNLIDFSDYSENFYQINSRKKRILVRYNFFLLKWFKILSR